MLDDYLYYKHSRILQDLCRIIPRNWGQIQNDGMDKKLNLFQYRSIDALEKGIQPLQDSEQNYFRRRWFIWQCSQIDEFLFYRNRNVFPNENAKDKEYDIEFNEDVNLRFDVKGTIVPKSMSDGFTILDERKIIEFYYDNQSTGIRDHIQNRLFIVHHSFRKRERNMILRCHWDLKKIAYQNFALSLSENTSFINYKGVKAKCIFIFESKNGLYYYHINP
jgi:hypothetical protein